VIPDRKLKEERLSSNKKTFVPNKKANCAIFGDRNLIVDFYLPEKLDRLNQLQDRNKV
jgi:hypothetical protein